MTCTKWTPYATFAIQFVYDGLYGTIPASIQNYLDYDAIARDLGMDYSEITIDGTRYIYRCDYAPRSRKGTAGKGSALNLKEQDNGLRQKQHEESTAT